ncbi:hypothetical protein AB6D11_00690 [Vibrio splendidus]
MTQLISYTPPKVLPYFSESEETLVFVLNQSIQAEWPCTNLDDAVRYVEQYTQALQTGIRLLGEPIAIVLTAEIIIVEPSITCHTMADIN